MTSSSLFSCALLVEDEKNLAMALQIALQKLGIPSDLARTLCEAKTLINKRSYDFILLDRNLPDGDGLSLCEELRSSNFEGLILILTAVGGIEDRVIGLNAGADDYLPKPFSWQELEARIKALSRRKASGMGNQLLETQNKKWFLDENKLRVLGPKGWIELTPLEFKLASKLIHSTGKIVSRDDLLKDVWGFTLLPKTRTVDHFLGRLRKYFEEDPEDPRHFLTVRGAGYRFEP